MTSNTEFYYTLSTIPQVLAAFLGLSSIFLIYTYSQFKDEIIHIAANVHTVLAKYDNYRRIQKFRKILYTNISSKSVKSIRTSLYVLLNNKRYTEIFEEQLRKDVEDEAINKLLNQTVPYIKSIEKEILKATKFVKLSFYFGIIAIIFSIVLLLSVPHLCKLFLLITSIILVVLTFLSIFFMVWIIFRFLKFSKEEFEQEAEIFI